MRYITLTFLLSLFFAITITAQKKSKEVLFAEAKSPIDTVKTKATYQIAKNYLRINLDTCEQFATEAINLAKKFNNKVIESESYALLGAAKKYRGKFEESITYHLKALTLKETIPNDPYGMSITLNDLGILYKNLHRYNEAINYYRRSLFFSTKANNTRSIALTTSNIGTIFSETNKYDSAKYYYETALPIAKKSGDSNAIATVLSNLGEVYGNVKQYDLSLSYMYQCLPIDKALDDKYGIVTDYLNIAGTLMKLRKFAIAKPYLDSANKLSVEEGLVQQHLNALNSLSTYYTAINDMENADIYTTQLELLRDSLLNQETQDNISEINTKYETSKKEGEILKQRLQISQRNYMIGGILGVLILGSLLGFSYYRRNKLKQEKKLQQEVIKQQDLSTKAVIVAEENERKRIAADLHDGVGQILSAAKMNLSAFENEIPFSNENQKIAFEKVIHLVDESCKEIRSVSHQMMPNALLKSGLASAVKEFLDKLDSRILKVNLHTEGLNERIDSNIETVLYRVIQECVNNVIKHSGANMLDISLIKDSDGIAVTIEDNGKGFDTNDKLKFEGIGLKNIATRIGYLKGTVDFDSKLGNGTLVAIHVPVV